jgi:hypothetical protein
VFQSQRIHAEPVRVGAASAGGGLVSDTTAGPAGRDLGPTEPARAMRSPLGPPAAAAASVGERLLAAYRVARFNLLEASRQLQAGRLEGDGVTVADRAQLSHYLDGEILRAFLESGALSATVERLAAGYEPRHRVETRARRVLQHLWRSLEDDAPEEAFPRLPRDYRATFETLVHRGSEWTRAALDR